MNVRSEPLTAAQIRILGVLVEKQLTTPQSYPLTENALLAGCNQATNRDPVVDYDSAVVRPALIRLRERALARQVRRAGERAEKHAHRLDEQLGLTSVTPLAVLAVLMLRGPQTPGELRSRVQRLQPIADADALQAALSELHGRGLAESLPRQPGEKQVRWRHLLAGGDAEPEQDPEPHQPLLSVSPERDRPPVPGPHELAAVIELVEQLQRRVEVLERELGLVRDDVDGPSPAPPNHHDR